MYVVAVSICEVGEVGAVGRGSLRPCSRDPPRLCHRHAHKLRDTIIVSILNCECPGNSKFLSVDLLNIVCIGAVSYWNELFFI